MKGQTLQVRVVGGMEQSLPQDPVSASRIENWAVERSTLGLTSRVGYEKYRPDPADGFSPFAGLGRIDSLFVMQGSTGGARQSILFESGGALYLYYEVGQANVILNLGSRFTPTATDTASVYAQYGDRVVITNGYDSPIIVRPWPLPRATEVTSAQLASLSRQIGWYGPPPQPNALRVATIDASTPMASTNEYTGDSTTNWYPAAGKASVFPNIFGMGIEEAGASDEKNVFQFAVSFISDTGSESPLSTTVESTWRIEAGDNNVRYAPTIRIALGPPGTVARRIYGSLNGERELYFIADVRNNVEELFHCARREVTFSVPAPLSVDSAIFPAPRARCCAIYKNCLWLDGGADEGNRLFFSKPTLIDQFGAADYISLGSSSGAVTGLFAHYNNLLVFRENGIDIVTGSYPNFSVQSLSDQIACRSPQTIDSVPGKGVFFLALDGVYSISGGIEGGSVVQLAEASGPVGSELEKLTKECAARAVGKYSPTERAYHIYFPANGNDRPNLGLVYHMEKEGWSVRSGFPVGCIDRLHNGTLVFGHHLGNLAGQNSPSGLFVLSAVRAMGGTIVGDVFTPGAPPTSVYESAWHDFGDAQVKKQVQYVTLWIMTTGSVTLKLEDLKDFEYSPVDTNTQYIAQPPDQTEQPVYGKAVIGTDQWQDTRLSPIRIPIAQQSCSWFKFRLTTADDLVLVGYELEYTSRGTNVIAGRTP
jgi:hypothetical protein